MIEPDYGLLDELLSEDALNLEQYDLIRCGTVTVCQRNDQLLRHVTGNDVMCTALISALQRTDQGHVVNYIQRLSGKQIASQPVLLTVSNTLSKHFYFSLPTAVKHVLADFCNAP